jgi:two-component system cell cycle sensor histidine kinase/response regulator CckA
MIRPGGSVHVRNCRLFAHAVSALAVLIGSLAFLGWALSIQILTSILPGLATMKPNTALCFVLAGLSLWLTQPIPSRPDDPRTQRSLAAKILSSVVGIMGLLSLAEYAFGLNLGIDEILWSNVLFHTGIAHPGRMSSATACGFLFLGASVLFSTTRRAHLAQSLGLLAALDGFVGSLGYLLGAHSLYAVQPFSSMAIHTAILFLLLGIGTLAACPESGFMEVVTSPNLGGVMLRRLLPALLVIVLFLVWIRWKGQVAGFYGTEFGIVLVTVCLVVTIVVLLWLSAFRLNWFNQEQRLAERQKAHLAAIVESSLDAILSKDLSGKVTSWNKGAERLYGYSAAEIIGKPITTLIPEGTKEEVSEYLRRVSLGQRVTAEDTVRVRKDGTVVHVSLIISPLRDADGNVVGASAIAHDITERKEREAELRESEERFRLFIEHAPAALAMFDREMRYLHASHRWRTDYGLGDRHLYGVSHYEVFPELPERWREAHRRGLAGEVLRAESDDFDRPDGSRQSIRWEIRPWHDRTGGIGGILIFTEDITARKQAEEELSRSRQALEDKSILLESILDSMSEGLVAADEHGKFIVWNPAAEKIVGVGAADIVLEKWSQHYGLYLPDKVTPFPPEFNPLARAIRGETGTAVIYMRRPHFAEGVFVEAYASPLRDRHEGLRGGVAAFRDITERVVAEEKLREYERVVEGLEEMILVVDRQYRYLIANRAFLNFRGMVADQVVGHVAEEVVGKEVFETQIKPKMDECFLGKVVQYELTYDFPNVGRRDLAVSYLPIEGPSGVDHLACVLQDITERKLAEEALRKSEERFSKAFRNNPLAISLSREEHGRFLDVNQAFLDLLGYERQEVVGRTASEIRFWSEPSDRTAMLRQLREEERVAKRQIRYRTAKGEVREAETWAESIEVDGERCILGITRDVTEVQLLEAQFRQAQKMEAVGRLAGGVAHDFHNLLGVIMGYSDLALPQIPEESPAHRYVSETKKAAQRAAALTQQLLAFSRKQIVFPKVLDLNEVVQSATKMFLRLVGEDVAVQFRPTIPLENVKVDPGQIEQVLINLVVNARDAMPKGGKILIETTHAEIDDRYLSQHVGARAGRHVVLVVSDTGCGMNETTKSQIFDPFFTTKEPGKGTGLGLSTVYGIVKQNGGYIVVYSEPAKGTTFKIYFPSICERSPELAPPDARTEPPRGSETILVVEDDKNLREITVKLLQEAGYRVLAVQDAEEALGIVSGSNPAIDLVLTDVIMPGKSGAELAKEARERRPQLRLLFMSGYAGDLVTRQGVVIDESSFLEKPFTRKSLLTKVYTALHASEKQ